MKPIRIVLADDHNLVRAGIRALLQNMPDVQVIGEAANGREALDLVKETRPDLVLMDIAMPELNGLDATAELVKQYPKLRIIILSMYVTEAFVLEALRAGASGYLLKGAATPELGLAIHAVARGETYLSSAVSGHVIEAFKRIASSEFRASTEAGRDEVDLTPRQRQVLQLIAEGHSTKEIAEKLNISVKTAKTHRAELMRRLDMHDVASLVRYAMQIGLVTQDA